MDDNSFDERTINKIIPQIFEKKKSSNRGKDERSMITSKLQASMNQISSLATQSILDERSSLDGIIAMVDNVNKVLSQATPKNLERIHQVCRSTNFILDTWIDIQSQASYLNKMMKDREYLKYLEAREAGRDIIAEKTEEINKLKTELSILKGKPSVNPKQRVNNNAIQNRGARNITARNTTVKRTAIKSSNIPRVSSRITKPTASSQRRSFRK